MCIRDRYNMTGTIALKDYDDASNIVKGSSYFESDELKAREGRSDDIKETYERTKSKYFKEGE